MNKFRRCRTIAAAFMLVVALLLFLDFTGTIHRYLGWVAKIQFLPALLAVNVAIVVVLIWATLLFGRLYCSVICPMGLFQDAVSRFASLTNKKRKFKYTPARNILRYSVLVLFIAAFLLGVGSIVALLDPYGAFGRMISALLAPIYQMGNNVLAGFAERAESYAFYSVEVIWMSGGVIAVALATFVAIGVLSWRNGRTYCNTICPVGTVLGFVSKYSLYRINVDTKKCNGCRKCVRQCKSACITPETREIDYSRCVTCFDCIDSCSQGAISYVRRGKRAVTKQEKIDTSKRDMLAVGATLVATSALASEEKLVDGGLAIIEDKLIPERQTPIVPAGSVSLRNFAKHCVGCQLCVTVCPNDVLRPSTDLMKFMQPEVSYEKGYCRPECTKCSEVCPAGAILKIDRAEKSSTQIGHAVWIQKNCVVLTDNVDCGACAVHCPVGAIKMVKPNDEQKFGGRKIPVVNAERCIGCGACENLCPARPFSAIYVEGHSIHKTI